MDEERRVDGAHQARPQRVRMSTTAIAADDEPSEIHSRRPGGSTVTWRASAPTLHAPTTPPAQVDHPELAAARVGDERVRPSGEGGLTRLLEPTQDPCTPAAGLEQRHRPGRAVPDVATPPGPLWMLRGPSIRVHPPDRESHSRGHHEVRLSVGGHERGAAQHTAHDRHGARTSNNSVAARPAARNFAAVHRTCLRSPER